MLSVESRVASGLGRPELLNWFSRFQEVIARLKPDVALLSFGSNDAHGYMSGVPEGTSIGALGSASWNAEYRRRVAGVTEAFAHVGAYVIWLGLQIARSAKQSASFRTVNGVLREVAAAQAVITQRAS